MLDASAWVADYYVDTPAAGTFSPGLSQCSAPQAPIMIGCQVKSASAVNGSTVWDLLTDGNFVSDYYTDTPVTGDYSPGMGRCVTAHQQ
ncbi:MAG: hypothetical protein M3Y17_12100 [Actinomycetota bacterium]|nr:hypothetical protein [Actinomycetota bacterium]